MMLQELLIGESYVAPEDWDDWLETGGNYAGARQTSGRAVQYDIEYGGRSYFLEARRGGARVAGMLASWVPASGRFANAKRLAQTLAKARYSRVEVFDGPAVPSGEFARAEPLIDRLDVLAWRHRAAGIRFSCFPPGYDVSVESELHRMLLERGYRRRDWNTAVLDLGVSEQRAFSELRDKERSAIRKCEANGVVFHECADAESFLRLFIAGYYEGANESRFAKALRQWRATLSNYYRYFVALSADGEALATLATYRFNGYVTVRRIRRTDAGKASKLPIQDFLHWRTMNFHRALGDRWFDLAGFAADPADDKERGIRFFKTKWGGEIRPSPRYYKDLRPHWQRVLPLLNRTYW